MEITLSDKCFNDYLKLIHELTGITIAANRMSMVEGRLRKRLVALNLPSYEDYLRLVKEDHIEREKFIDLVTTNETSFFRTPRIWDYIEKTILPKWIERHSSKKTFHVWSAAASSGEEAHSLGIILQNFKEKHPDFTFRVTGTDISSEMVDLCNKGEYSGRSLDYFQKNKPDLFRKYMVPVRDSTFKLIPDVKSHLHFTKHNLFRAFKPREKFDLVLVRNVLIYFSAPDQEKVLSLIESNLNSDGILIIGESESLSHIKTPYQHMEPLIYSLKSRAKSDGQAA